MNEATHKTVKIKLKLPNEIIWLNDSNLNNEIKSPEDTKYINSKNKNTNILLYGLISFKSSLKPTKNIKDAINKNKIFALRVVKKLKICISLKNKSNRKKKKKLKKKIHPPIAEVGLEWIFL